jgi:hypothetical protein
VFSPEFIGETGHKLPFFFFLVYFYVRWRRFPVVGNSDKSSFTIDLYEALLPKRILAAELHCLAAVGASAASFWPAN